MFQSCHTCGSALDETGLCTCRTDDDEVLDFRETASSSGEPAQGRFGRLQQQLLLWSRGEVSATDALRSIDGMHQTVAAGRRFLQDAQHLDEMQHQERLLLHQADRSAETVQTLLLTLRFCVESADVRGALRFMGDVASELTSFERLMADLEP